MAPNRANNLRAAFQPNGVSLSPRILDTGLRDAPGELPGKMSLLELPRTAEPWQVNISLAKIGRGDVLYAVEPATLSANGNRLEYLRGNVTEWYLNDKSGMEQGFLILERPKTDNETLPLVLTLDVQTDLSMSLVEDGQAIEFLDQAGHIQLRYDGLQVWDSTQSQISAHLSLSDSQISILIHDQNALYPLTIDPYLTSPWAIDPANDTSADLGYDVGTAGDINGDGYADIILSAPTYGALEDGKVWVYQGSASGPTSALNITQDWEVTPTAQISATFGMAVAGVGDVNNDGFDDVLVGAPNFDTGSYSEGQVKPIT